MTRNAAPGPVPLGWRDRLRIFFLFTSAILALEIGHDVYQWFAYADERVQIRVLTRMVDPAGLEVIKTQLRVDTLRARIEGLDAALEQSRRGFEVYDRHSSGGGLPARLYDPYRRDVAVYNRGVVVRNVWVAEWQKAVTANREAVDQYNALADQIRSIALEMGERHYNIPSPAEAAVRSGLRP